MLSLFRNNQIYTVFFLALVTALLRLPAFTGWIVYQPVMQENAGVLYQLLFKKVLESPSASATLASIFVLAQALLVNWLANESRINPERNWFPGLFTAVFLSSVNNFQFLSPALVAATWIPLVLRRIFSVYKSNETTLTIFDAGLLVGLASLFYPPILWLAPMFILGVYSLRTIKTSELANFSIATGTPWFIAWGILPLGGGTHPGMNLSVLFNWVQFQPERINLQFWASIAVLFLVTILVLISASSYYRKRLIQVQKFNNILFWLLFGTYLTLLFIPVFDFSHILIASSSLGIFLSLSFLSIQNKLVAELLFVCLLAAIFIGLVPEQFIASYFN